MSLVKEHSVYSGHHQFQIKISDQQGLYSIQNLSVTVCDCSIAPNCHVKMARKAQMGPVAALMVTLAVLFFIGNAAIYNVLIALTVLIGDEGFCKQLHNTENPSFCTSQSNHQRCGKTTTKMPWKPVETCF